MRKKKPPFLKPQGPKAWVLHLWMEKSLPSNQDHWIHLIVTQHRFEHFINTSSSDCMLTVTQERGFPLRKLRPSAFKGFAQRHTTTVTKNTRGAEISNPGRRVPKPVLLSTTLCWPTYFPSRFRMQTDFQHPLGIPKRLSEMNPAPLRLWSWEVSQVINRLKIEPKKPCRSLEKEIYTGEEEGGVGETLLLTHPGIRLYRH